MRGLLIASCSNLANDGQLKNRKQEATFEDEEHRPESEAEVDPQDAIANDWNGPGRQDKPLVHYQRRW